MTGEEIRARLRAWFSDEISRHRSSDGISQAEFASRMGVSQATVSNWEIGEAIPRLEHIVQLAMVWGVEPYSLLPTVAELEAMDIPTQAPPPKGRGEPCAS